jgi:hypothetical protein
MTLALEFYFVEEELTANPDDVIAVRSLANKTKSLCSFELSVDEIESSAKLGEVLRSGIENDAACDVTPCMITDCKFDATKDDFYDIYDCSIPGCDVVIDVDMDEKEPKVFIASVAYSEEQGVDPKDVQLIGLYEKPLEETTAGSNPSLRPPDGPRSLLGFPLNQPVTPGIVPRFRTYFDLETRMEQAISDDGYENVTVAFSYVLAAMNTGDPNRIEVNTAFKGQAAFNFSSMEEEESPFGVGFNASAGVGDLKAVRLDEDQSKSSVSVMAQYSAELGVVLAPNESQDIIIIGNACNGRSSKCDLDAMKIQLEYWKGDLKKTVFLDLSSARDASPSDELKKALAEAQLLGDVVKNVTMHGTPDFPSTLFVIRFDPSVTHVLFAVPKDCLDPETFQTVDQNVLMCEKDKRVNYTYNAYGLQDQDLARRPFQISVRRASIEADFEVEGNELLYATVADTVEMETYLTFSLNGSLSLSIDSGDFLPFCDWLIAIVSIFETEKDGRIDDFLSASSTFESRTFSGAVKPLPPFDNGAISEAVVNGGLEQPFDVDFMGKDSTPPVSFPIELPVCIRSLSYTDVVDSLSKAVKFIVGNGELQTAESCSGGLLGSELVNYQIPST